MGRRHGNTYHRFNLDQVIVDGIKLIAETISHLKGRGVYTIITFVDGKTVLSSKPLGLLCGRFGFVRIHKGTAVNPNCVSEIDPLDRLIMRSGAVLEVSRRRKAHILRIIVEKKPER